MGLPTPPIASNGNASVRARLVVARAGAAPARTGMVAALRPSSPAFSSAGARFAGGVRGGGEWGGGDGARLAGAAVDTGLRRPAAPAIKMSHFPSYGGGGAVICLARRADGEGDGYRGAGAGGEGNGDGGAGAGGDDYNAKKGCALKQGKDTEGAPAGGGGGSGDGCAKKGCAFDKGNGMDGAPAGGGGGAGGNMGGSVASVHRRNAEKDSNFSKVPGAAAAAGRGGSDRADQAPRRRRKLSADPCGVPSFLEEMKTISKLLEEAMSFRFMLKRLFWKITIILPLTMLGLLLMHKVAKAIGLTDIHGFLKNVFITFITDEEIRAKAQEAINSYADDIIDHLIPWFKVVRWCKRYVEQCLSRKK